MLLIILSFVFLLLGDKRDSMDKKDAFNEIFDIIASRNPDMLVGYNRDTCDRANVLIKEIKQKKKNSK